MNNTIQMGNKVDVQQNTSFQTSDLVDCTKRRMPRIKRNDHKEFKQA
jgi:hypothetical protein